MLQKTTPISKIAIRKLSHQYLQLYEDTELTYTKNREATKSMIFLSPIDNNKSI